MTCLLLAQYRERFQPTVVYFNIDNGPIVPEFNCGHGQSHLTSRNLANLLEVIKKSFRFRRKFVIVATSSASLRLLADRSLLQKYVAHLGFSRWLLHLVELSLGFQLEEELQCFSIFANGTTANIPSDFVNCTERRYISAQQVGHVERFTRKPKSFVCSSTCFGFLTRKGEKTNLAIKWLGFLRASNFTLEPNVQYLDGRLGDEIEQSSRLLATRRKELGFDGTVISDQRYDSMIFGVPIIYLEFNVMVKRRFHKALGNDRLVRLFDGWTWLAVAISFLAQVFCIIGLTRCTVLDASYFVYSLLFGESGQKSLAIPRHLLSFMLIAWFVLGLAFRNKLLSSFNAPTVLIFDSVDDLRRGYDENILDGVCVYGGAFVVRVADARSLQPLLRFLGEFRDKNRLVRLASLNDCVDHVIENPNRAALMVLSGVYLRRMSLLSRARIGQPIASSFMSSLCLPPWSPHEALFNKVARRVFESKLESFDNLVRSGSAPWMTYSSESLHILDLRDLRFMIVSWFAGLALSCMSLSFELISFSFSTVIVTHWYRLYNFID